MVRKIINIFKSKGLIVTRIADYNKYYWIVEAKMNPNNPDEMDCWHGVRKKDFEIVTFYPMQDFNKFVSTITNNLLYTRS